MTDEGKHYTTNPVQGSVPLQEVVPLREPVSYLDVFLAAIGGALLGMLLTFLVLAVVNGGTLAFNDRLLVQEVAADVDRVDLNLGAQIYNEDRRYQELDERLKALETAK